MTRVMLAVTCDDLSKVSYPCYLSPKIDGVRMYVQDGVCYGRSGKPIPSRCVQEKFGRPELNGFDGELCYGSPRDEGVFQKTQSFCMSYDVPDGMDHDGIDFFVFDSIIDNTPFSDRLEYLKSKVPGLVPYVFVLAQHLVEDQDTAEKMEGMCLKVGYEGAMIRKPDAMYKHGRATLNKGELLRLKRFVDDEATIVSLQEMYHNNNEAKINELGYTERSSAKAGKQAAGVLGAFVVHHPKFGEFDVGTGFTAEQREKFWLDRDNLVGKIIKFKYFPKNIKDKPRFPTFLGFRHEVDL